MRHCDLEETFETIGGNTMILLRNHVRAEGFILAIRCATESQYRERYGLVAVHMQRRFLECGCRYEEAEWPSQAATCLCVERKLRLREMKSHVPCHRTQFILHKFHSLATIAVLLAHWFVKRIA